MRKLLVLLFLAGCYRIHHIDPKPRQPEAERLATVRVDVTCTTEAPFKTGDPGDPHQFDSDIEWIGPRTATGVIVSDRHVVTAAHAVFCPTIPGVVVTLQDGRRFRMDAERDDAVFGSGTDVARLVISADDRFFLDLTPPELGSTEPDGYVVASTLHGFAPGTFTGVQRRLDGVKTRPGDSGSGVYTMSGQLIGIIVKGGTYTDGTSFSTYEPLTPYWLEGT